MSTLKAVNPQLMDKDDLDAVYMAVVELQQVSDAVQAQHEAVRVRLPPTALKLERDAHL